MTGAPDFFEPLIGFRAWHVDAQGRLTPWAFPHEAWTPGPNRARCHSASAHRPPVAECMCGLYGLTRTDDHRLNFADDQAVGAIAAWGDIEAHRTGFRAEWACVTALAEPPRSASSAKRARIDRAATRYDVPLVPRDQLFAEAQRHGAPLPVRTWRRPVADPKAVPPLGSAQLSSFDRGIATEEHLWVELSGPALRLGITDEFARRLGELDASFPLPPVGRTVARGDVLTVLGSPGGSYHVTSPFAGTIAAVNTALRTAPRHLLRDPAREGWLVEVMPSAWQTDARGVAWGRGRGRAYAALLSALGEDPLAGLHVERLRALPPVGSWRDVATVLRRERQMGWFGSAEEVYERLGRSLLAALAADPDRRRALGRLDMQIAFRLSEPAAVLRLRARPSGVSLLWGSAAAGGADLELTMTADAAHDYFTGRVDPAVALRTGVVVSSRPRAATLRALSVLKWLRLPRLRQLASWERAAAEHQTTSGF